MSDLKNSDRKLQGIVSKPQFDTDVYYPGKCISVSTKEEYVYSGLRHLVTEAIITKSNPLKIEILYVFKGSKENLIIPIEFITDKKVEIEPLISKILDGNKNKGGFN